MTPAYLTHQAERPRTPAEQRELDVRAGELAASFVTLFSSLGKRVRSRPRPLPAAPPKQLSTSRC